MEQARLERTPSTTEHEQWVREEVGKQLQGWAASDELARLWAKKDADTPRKRSHRGRTHWQKDPKGEREISLST